MKPELQATQVKVGYKPVYFSCSTITSPKAQFDGNPFNYSSPKCSGFDGSLHSNKLSPLPSLEIASVISYDVISPDSVLCINGISPPVLHLWQEYSSGIVPLNRSLCN